MEDGVAKLNQSSGDVSFSGDEVEQQPQPGKNRILFFRPSATVSHIGLMESCTCRCGGPPPPHTNTTPPLADPPLPGMRM